MFRFAPLIAAGSLAFAPVSPALAADSNGEFAAKGAGRLTCEQYLGIREQKSRDYYVTAGWIEGYISGINALQPKTYDATPWQTTELVLGLLARACESETDARILDLINRYLREVITLRLREKSELVTVSTGDAAVLIYREVLSMVQQRLEAINFDPGTTDGAPDNPATVAALSAFQKERGLPETGLPDQLTLLNLFFAPVQ